jgi:hypothetical protein
MPIAEWFNPTLAIYIHVNTYVIGKTPRMTEDDDCPNFWE